MIYLVTLTIVLVSIFLYLLIELKKSVHLLYVIPLTILFTSGSYFYLDSLFGYPVPKTIEKRFNLLYYYVPSEEDNLYLWVLLEDETIPKVIFVPYTQEQHEVLEEARKKIEDGQQVVGEFLDDDQMVADGEEVITQSTQTNYGSNKSKGGQFVLYDMDIDSILPRK